MIANERSSVCQLDFFQQHVGFNDTLGLQAFQAAEAFVMNYPAFYFWAGRNSNWKVELPVFVIKHSNTLKDD